MMPMRPNYGRILDKEWNLAYGRNKTHVGDAFMKRFVLYIAVLSLLVSLMISGHAEAQEEVLVLRVRSTGQEVVDLQLRLRDLGYFNYKVTGYFGNATQNAVRNFQERNGLPVVGHAGPQTMALLYSCEAQRETVTAGQAAAMLPVSRGGRTTLGKMVVWSTARNIIPKGSRFRVTDLNTGTSFTLLRTGGTLHADVEPASRADTDRIRSIWGGWNWERRAVIVEAGGERMAASMHGMPHAYNSISGNGMQGHLCLHFYQSRIHIRNRICPDHQAMVRRAAGR